MPRALLPVVIAAAILAACTGDDGTEAPPVSPTPVVRATASPPPAVTPVTPAASTPDPAPTIALVDGLPVDAVGPLVVYARVAWTRRARNQEWPTWVVTTYDVGLQRAVSTFNIGEFMERVNFLGLNDRELLIRLNHRLIALDLAGDELRTIYSVAEDRLAPHPLVSPDGSMLVFVEFREGCEQYCVVVIDSERGDELMAVPQSTAGLTTLNGYAPRPSAWRDDGRGIVVVGRGRQQSRSTDPCATMTLSRSSACRRTVAGSRRSRTSSASA
jgi:hypothetical protein